MLHSNTYYEMVSSFRWEITGTEQLPNFMKIALNALYDITNNILLKWSTKSMDSTL